MTFSTSAIGRLAGRTYLFFGHFMFAFGLSAEIERDLISQRTKEALSRKKSEGVVLGRPKGRTSAPEALKLWPRRHLIARCLADGVSPRQTARRCGCSFNTLRRFVEVYGNGQM